MPEPLRVLVVDDEEDVQILFTQRFRREIRSGKVELRFALSGETALDTLRRGAAANVVFVLSDINMPGMTGIELLAAIKEEFPDLRVVMVTAYDDATLRARALAHGAEGYYTKPIDFDELKQEVFGLTA